MSSGRFRLTMRKGPMPGKVYELAKSVLTIGRDVKNDIVINDSEVSRQHVRLTEQENGYQIEDLASTNGAFINGQRLSAPMLLQPRDLLGLGETIELEFGTPPTPDATVVAGPYSSAPDMPRPEEPVMPVSASAPPSPLPRTAPFGSSASSSASAPASPFAAQEKKSVSPWVWGVGIGCGVLLLCVCVSSVAVAFLWPQIEQMMR